jgi:hypothetical protein
MKCAACLKLKLLDLLDEFRNPTTEQVKTAYEEVPDAIAVDDRSLCYDHFLDVHFWRGKTIEKLRME